MSTSMEIESAEINLLLQDLKSKIDSMNVATPEKTKEAISTYLILCQQYNLAIESFKLDLSEITDDIEKQEYSSELNRIENEYIGLTFSFKEKKKQLELQELKSELRREKTDVSIELTSQQLVMKGDEIQDLTEDSINRMKFLVNDAELIGVTGAAILQQDHEKLGLVGENLNKIKETANQTENVMDSILKAATQDRCLQILVVGIVLCIIIIIILYNI